MTLLVLILPRFSMICLIVNFQVRSVGPVVTLHHLFCRMPSELNFPATSSDKRRYVQWAITQPISTVVIALEQQLKEYKVKFNYFGNLSETPLPAVGRRFIENIERDQRFGNFVLTVIQQQFC